MKKANKYAAPALDKGLDILEHLSQTGIPQSQSEVAEALGRKTNEIFRMLACLETRAYILRDPVSGKYQLSLKLYHLSHTHSPVETLRHSAMSPMRNLVDRVGHPAHLCVVDQGALLVVSQVRSSNPVSLSIAEGSRFPLVHTTSGMLMLANHEKEEQGAILDADTEFQTWSKTKRNQYRKKLKKLAAQGFCLATSDITQGVTDITALIGKPGDPILATVAISCVSSLLGSSKSDKELLKATIEAAQAISEAIGLDL